VSTPGRLVLAAGTLWKREMTRFLRQRSRMIGALLTPGLFWLLIGAGIGSSFQPAGSVGEGSFLAYFFSGSMVLILLFTAIFSTITVIEDRREGFLQSVLVAPVPRVSIVLGKVLGGATLATVQGALFLLLAPLAGIPISPLSGLQAVGILALIAFWLTALGFCIAWVVDSIQGFHVMMNLFLMPMWMLSGALYPASGAAGWIRLLMHLNPLTYGMAAVRHVLPDGGGTASLPPFSLCLGVTASLAVGTLLAAVALSHRTSRSTS